MITTVSNHLTYSTYFYHIVFYTVEITKFYTFYYSEIKEFQSKFDKILINVKFFNLKDSFRTNRDFYG